MKALSAQPTAEFLALQEALAGRYSLERELGRGGMGIVFRAIREDGAVVALKVLKPGLVRDENVLRRFAREARAAAAVDHPQLIDVIQAGDIDGTSFLAMRYVAGKSLDDRIRDHGPLPLEDMTRIVAEIAPALDALHAAGLVHRDVKPSNILLDAERAIPTSNMLRPPNGGVPARHS